MNEPNPTAQPSAATSGPPGGPIEIVFAGNLIVDDLVFPDGRTRVGQAGGAMLYASLGAALWGAQRRIVSVVGNDYPPSVMSAVESRGVDTSAARKVDHPGLRTWLLYEREGRRVVHHLGVPPHAEMSPVPSDIPAAYAGARAFHLAPMPHESQRALLESLSAREGALLSLDPFEPLREDNQASWSALVSRADIVFVGEDDFRLDGIERDPRAALKRLAIGRIKLAAFKQGAKGGLLYERAGDRFHSWPGAHPPIVDPTGAGDAFAGGFLAGFLATGKVEPSLEQGAISASFAIENWGARGLLSSSRSHADHRRHVWYGARAGA